MSGKPRVTSREELDQTVDRPVLLGSLALEDQRPRSTWQHSLPPDNAESPAVDNTRIASQRGGHGQPVVVSRY
jgi:hypothetical protein